MINLAANYIYDGLKLKKNAYVSVDNQGKILYVSDENEALVERERTIFYNGIISPGFVNSHCHIELSSLKKRIPQNIGMTEFINNVSRIRTQSNNQIKQEILKADQLMYNNGISAVGDIMNTDNSIEIKRSSKIYYHNFIEVFGIDYLKSKQVVQQALLIRNSLSEAGLKSSITPHAFYSINNDLYDFILKHSSPILSIHFLESEQELNLYENKTGQLYDFLTKTNPDYIGMINSLYDLKIRVHEVQSSVNNLILVHNIEMEESFFETCKSSYLCICPRSNMFIHNKLPSKALFESNNNIIIGTDSLASNDTLCILEEIKCLFNNYNNISLTDALKWATYNGAKALGIDDNFGRLKKSFAPGIILLENLDLKNLLISNETTVKRLF